MRQLSIFSKAIILVAVCYIGLAYGIRPPLPGSILYLYMALIIIGILSQIGVEDEKLREFARPIVELLADKDKARRRLVVFTLLPLTVAFFVYSSTSVSSNPPAELRTVHPAPPATIQFRGRDLDLAARAHRMISLEDGRIVSDERIRANPAEGRAASGDDGSGNEPTGPSKQGGP